MKRRLVTPIERCEKAKRSDISVCQPMHYIRPVLQSLVRVLEHTFSQARCRVHAICPVAYLLNPLPFQPNAWAFFCYFNLMD